jgi:glycosyltransferase involved in cell wall biosynthesis
MRVCITLEHRFLRTPDGRIWTVTQFPYEFFKSYLEVFESVRIVARAFAISKPESNFHAVTGPGVEFKPFPAYKGPFEFARHYFEVKKCARNAVAHGDAVILRVHGQVANSLHDSLAADQIPFALEVVADPFDAFSPTANRHPIAPLARKYFTKRLKAQCRQALAVSYVTRSSLQARYPPAAHNGSAVGSCASSCGPLNYSTPGNGQYIASFSDVDLPSKAYAPASRTGGRSNSTPQIVLVGALTSPSKGHDVLLKALALNKESGLQADATFIGSGAYESTLQKLSAELGIADQVCFRGSLPAGVAIRDELDRADLFILPSRAEGLPRAMLEAMARGLPCLGSTVGGIPELLDAEDMVPPDDPIALARIIREVLQHEQRLRDMSHRCLETARLYAVERLIERRRQFYRAVRELTKAHYLQQQDSQNTSVIRAEC